jgi:hypothetical protein
MDADLDTRKLVLFWYSGIQSFDSTSNFLLSTKTGYFFDWHGAA